MWAASLAGAVIVEMGAAHAARAAEDPLLVVVETQPGLGVDAADVRRRIAGELGARVVSPSDPAATRASQVLIVALDEHDIRISMRSGASARVSRTIPDVAERAARLRAVAWLAGNLARDQVGPLLPNLALAPTPKPPADPTPAATAAAAASPPAAIATPPAVGSRPVNADLAAATDATVSVRIDESPSAVDSRWMITASGGATFADTCLQVSSPAMFSCTTGIASSFSYGSTYQLEALHRTPDQGTMIGAALDTGPDYHLVGLAGLIGVRRPWGHWYLEATLGAGIEAERANVATTTVLSSSTSGTSNNVTVTQQVQPALYVRAKGSIGIPINRSFDFLASLDAHFASSGLATDFIGATAGLRLKLP
jgi:hypothetical protein